MVTAEKVPCCALALPKTRASRAGGGWTDQFPGGWGSDSKHSSSRRSHRTEFPRFYSRCKGRPARPGRRVARPHLRLTGACREPHPEGTRGGGGALGGGVARLSKAPAAPDQRGGCGRGRDGWIERRSQLQQDGPPAARGRAPGTSRGGRARHPLPGRLRPGEAARARRDQQHEQRLQQPGGGR